MRVLLALALAASAASAQDPSGARRLSAAASDQGLPAGWRVVLLPGQNEPKTRRAAWWKGGAVREGKLPAALVEPGGAPASWSAKDESRAALEEALLTVDLAHRLDGGAAPAYSSYLARLGKKLSCLAAKPDAVAAAWPGFKDEAAKELAFDLADKPAGLARYKALIFGTHDPSGSGGRLSASTMLIPLNKAWFQTDPRLKAYYAKEFLGGGFDVRIEGGTSGEGVTLNEKEPNGSFPAYEKTLFKLRDFTAGLADAKLSASPEGRWLAGLDEAAFKGIRRMIFVHEHTWEKIGSGAQWADFIPVDQSFAGLAPNYLLSVLIHEINVNSYDPSFLPADTHMRSEDSDAARAAFVKNGAAALEKPSALRAFFGLEPFLGSIYLGIYAERLAARVPACR